MHVEPVVYQFAAVKGDQLKVGIRAILDNGARPGGSRRSEASHANPGACPGLAVVQEIMDETAIDGKHDFEVSADIVVVAALAKGAWSRDVGSDDGTLIPRFIRERHVPPVVLEVEPAIP